MNKYSLLVSGRPFLYVKGFFCHFKAWNKILFWPITVKKNKFLYQMQNLLYLIQILKSILQNCKCIYNIAISQCLAENFANKCDVCISLNIATKNGCDFHWPPHKLLVKSAVLCRKSRVELSKADHLLHAISFCKESRAWFSV